MSFYTVMPSHCHPIFIQNYVLQRHLPNICYSTPVCLHYEVKAILRDASVNIFFQNVRLLCCSHNNSLRATIVVIDGVHILRLQICVAVPVIAEF
jgi:hypothetical protein